MSQREDDDEEEEDDDEDDDGYVVPEIEFVPIDPRTEKIPVLATDKAPNQLTITPDNVLDIEERDEQKISPYLRGFFGKDAKTQEEIEGERQQRISEIVSQIKNTDQFKGRVVRSPKNRGQSSQPMAQRKTKDPNSVFREYTHSHVNDYGIIRQLWESNYGVTQKKSSDMTIGQAMLNPNSIEARPPKPKKKGPRERCRYRKEWAKNLLKRNDN